MPAEIGQLTSLQILFLDHNQFSTLPVEIGQLASLQRLFLNSNYFSTLPTGVCQLSSLQVLGLSNNGLCTLPAEMGNLTSLQILQIWDNPLQPPLPELVEQDIPALLAYLRTLQPIKIFYCYAHEDEDLRDRVDEHLSVLKQLGHIVGWYDREIQAGTEWEREIGENLSAANIILLLVSANFMYSDYCYGVEMQKALEMHKTGRACVIPILLRQNCC